MARIFKDRFEPKSGDEYETHLFHMIIQEMHSANHGLDDAVSRDSGVMRAVREYEEYLKEVGDGSNI
jgi:hypothetical protein